SEQKNSISSIITKTMNKIGRIWKLSIMASASQSGIPKLSIIPSNPEKIFSLIVLILFNNSISIS
ncbi:MAG: hypothetical protein ACLSA2_02195, partial [Candidatus Gastranaerophilaceae bacterium]